MCNDMEWVSVNTGKYQISPGIFKCVEFHLLKGYRLVYDQNQGFRPKANTETKNGRDNRSDTKTNRN